ncbi:MAG: peptidylprolyl isomerase [Magnetococcus sp. MYC-9]
MRIRCLVMALAALSWVAPVVAEEDGGRIPAVVAEMGGIKISDTEYHTLKSQMAPEVQDNLEKDAKFRAAFVKESVIKKYVASQGRGAGFDRKPEVRQHMDRAAEQVLMAQYVASLAEPPADFPSEEEVKRAYEQSKDRLRKPGQVRIAQIFLAVPQDADAARKKDVRGRVYQIFKEAVANPKKFGELAKAKSDHSESAAKGGDMGWVGGNQLTPELLPIIAALQPNEISSPVQTAGGWHLFKVLETKKGEQLPLSAVKSVLIKALRQQEKQKKEQEYFAQLLQSTPVSVFIK